MRITALERIDTADQALARFERTLLEKKIDIDKSVVDVVSDVPFWKPWEQHRLSQIQKQLHYLCDGVYSASDDIAALVRCRQETAEMGQAIADSAYAKRELQAQLLRATVREAIEILRGRLAEHKAAINN